MASLSKLIREQPNVLRLPEVQATAAAPAAALPPARVDAAQQPTQEAENVAAVPPVLDQDESDVEEHVGELEQIQLMEYTED